MATLRLVLSTPRPLCPTGCPLPIAMGCQAWGSTVGPPPHACQV